MSDTKIEWCDKTWNPITGCSKVSPSCDNCYARRAAYSGRLRCKFGYPQDEPFRVTFHPDRLAQPLKWKKPRTIFVCSMGDLFHNDVKDEWLWQIYDIMAKARSHTYLLLTKRPENIKIQTDLSNIMTGVTVENQEQAEKRIPLLIDKTNFYPNTSLFVSCEPLLGPVDLSPWIDKIDWVIVGGETGRQARPLDYSWIVQISQLCKKHETPYFFKKFGAANPTCQSDNMVFTEIEERREFPSSLKHKV